MKVTVVGAGNVGATVANVLATKNICSEVVLIDIKEGVSEGKAMDIMQTAHLLNFDTTVTGVTNDYAATAGSQVVVVTSGIPRKPGMSREDLIGTNAKIVKSVVDQALEYSPDAIFIIISNPMDAMTYLATVSSARAACWTAAVSAISCPRLSRRPAILPPRLMWMAPLSAATATRPWFLS